MPSARKWTDEQLKTAAETSTSIRQVIRKLGLIEAGGNYVQVPAYIKRLNIPTGHFTGTSWNKGLQYKLKPNIPYHISLYLDQPSKAIN